MSRYTGIWIDHKKAVIVFPLDEEPSVVRIKSGVEGHYRLKGGARAKTPYGSQDATSESRREGRYKHHLQEYYRRIIGVIRDSESVLVFGPGEAKQEFVKEFGKEKALAGRIAGVEAADRMTEPQIAARVRKYFEPEE